MMTDKKNKSRAAMSREAMAAVITRHMWEREDYRLLLSAMMKVLKHTNNSLADELSCEEWQAYNEMMEKLLCVAAGGTDTALEK